VKVGDKQVLALSAMTPINAGKTRMNQIIWSDHPAFTALYPVIRVAAAPSCARTARSSRPRRAACRTIRPVVGGRRRPAGPWYRQLKREWNASRRERRPFRNPVEAATLRWRT